MFAKAIQNSHQYNNGKIIISKISREEAEAFKAEKDDYKSEYRLSGNGLEDFDLYFL